MDYPKISIITPSYNQGQFLEQTILSVIGQNYPNLQYIIIDGGSTDNSIAIIKKYQSYLSYWVSEHDDGQSSAINKGFEKASGDIFAWINSDDMYLPGTLKYVSEQIIKNGDGFYFGECIHFRQNNDSLLSSGSEVHHANKLTDLSERDFIIQPSTFWTKVIWDKVGILREDLHFAFDWEWYLRVKQNGIQFLPLNFPCSLYRIHDAHKTATGGSLRQNEIFIVYKCYNQKLSGLYEKVCRENLTSSDFWFRIIRKVLSIIQIKLSFELFLRIFKFRNYKEYTLKEINQVLQMK